MNVDVFQLGSGRFIVAGYVACSGEYHDPVSGEIGCSPEELVDLGSPSFATREKAEAACRILQAMPDGAIWIPDPEDCG